MSHKELIMMLSLCTIITMVFCQASQQQQQQHQQESQQQSSIFKAGNSKDVEFAAASGKLLDLFSKYPSYYNRPFPYPGNQYNPNYYPGGGLSGGGLSGGYPGFYPNSYPGGGVGGGFGQYPGAPGTNYLGSGGYGGYGGFNGNDGLLSYFGYKNPNYSGNRNVGFGYYQGTNTFGLGTPTLNTYTTAKPYLPSGFRGYN